MSINPALKIIIISGWLIPKYVFIEENTPFAWSIKIGQISCIFCKAGMVSLKSNKTGKKHTTHEIIKAVTGEPILALKNNVIVVRAAIPKIFNITEIVNICKKVKLYIDEA